MADELKKDGAIVETVAVDLASDEGLRAISARAQLAYELRNSGVRVVTVCSGFTKPGLDADSGVPGMAGKLLPFATPEEVVVRVALTAYDAGRVVRVVGLT